MRRTAELVGVLSLTFALSTCGLLVGGPREHEPRRVVAVSQNADGSISVSDAAPWWGAPLAAAVSALAAAAGAVYLNNRPPPGGRQ